MKSETIRPTVFGLAILASLLLLPVIFFWFEGMYIMFIVFTILFVSALIASRLPFISLEPEFITFRRFFATHRIRLNDIEAIELAQMQDVLAPVSEISADWFELRLWLRDGSRSIIHLGSFGKPKVERFISALHSRLPAIQFVESKGKTL